MMPPRVRLLVLLRTFPFCVCLASAQIGMYTYHNDLARTGQNLNETALTPDAVASPAFHQIFSHAVDGVVYAQPLYVPAVTIPGSGAHNVIYVATEHDSVYAFDADSIDGGNAQPLWHVTFLGPGITTVPYENTNCAQIVPEIGITGTPVIDPSSATLYVVAMTLENGTYHHRLHALDIGSGMERAGSPVDVQAPGFVPRNYKERPGLLLLNGVVYTSWSSHCDIGVYHGFIMGYDAKTLQQVAVYNDTPNGNEASFWASGAAPAADANGNIFVISGNGTFDADHGGQDLGESFIKLSTTNGLAVADYFTPFNQATLNANDADTGSSGALLLPDSAGSPQHPHLLVSAGKEGRIYLLDRDNMGRFRAGGDTQIPQSITGQIGGLFGIPAYFRGAVYFSAAGDHLKAFAIGNGQLSSSPISQTSATFDYPGSTPVVSANGESGGIVWAVEPSGGGALHAYLASDLSRELYSSASSASDRLGSYVKFSSPTVANGKVYVGTQNSVAVFGLAAVNGSDSLTVVNAASYAGPVAPGSIVSIFGSFSVPASPSGVTPLPYSLASVSVRINGVLAPLLYAGDTQVNAQIPFETPVGRNLVALSIAGHDWGSGTVSVAPAAPGLFTISGRAAVTNQDGSINGPDRPAAVNSIVAAYLTGQGAVQPAVPTGVAAPLNPLSRPAADVTASIGGQQAYVSFAGLTPTLVGVFQVNMRVPQIASGPQIVIITVGGVSSNAAPMYVASQ